MVGHLERFYGALADRYSQNGPILPPEFQFIFLKHNSYEGFEASDYVRSVQPWLNRYTGECRRIVSTLAQKKWIGSVVYAVGDRRGAYKIIGREECRQLCGPKALERELRDEDDWFNF
jgi:hypothetical protein